MNRLALYFNSPRQVVLREEPVPPVVPGQALVQTLLSAISAGTEMLVYRGEAPIDETLDETIKALPGTFTFPLKYGYSTVGRVVAAGPGLDSSWEGKRVFAFHPHESYFLASSDELMSLPDDISAEDAVFFPGMETAINFVMDGHPLIGERVVVFGQGVVGLLTAALLARFPLASLITIDPYPLRRDISLRLGVKASLDPAISDAVMHVTSQQQDEPPRNGADLVYELSGAPEALDRAIEVTGFGGRVVIGSWYGRRRVTLDLGGRFHRSKIRLISSQVSRVSPEFSGRWDKARRFQITWDMVREIRPSQLISHTINISRAAEAYRLLDEKPAEAVQVVFNY